MNLKALSQKSLITLYKAVASCNAKDKIEVMEDIINELQVRSDALKMQINLDRTRLIQMQSEVE